MIVELIIGAAIGGTVVAYHLNQKYERVHSNCPYNKDKSSYKNHSYTVSGQSINIGQDGKLIVDGKVIADGMSQCYVKITVDGDCHDLTTHNGDVVVKGNITNNIKTSNGDVTIGEFCNGTITTVNGDVECKGDIYGNISTKMGNISSN